MNVVGKSSYTLFVVSLSLAYGSYLRASESSEIVETPPVTTVETSTNTITQPAPPILPEPRTEVRPYYNDYHHDLHSRNRRMNNEYDSYPQQKIVIESPSSERRDFARKKNFGDYVLQGMGNATGAILVSADVIFACTLIFGESKYYPVQFYIAK